MKKWSAAIAAGLILLAPSVMAMDSSSLLADPVRYRVVFSDEKKAIYADMDTVTAVESRDFPSSIENFTLTLYVEQNVRDPNAMDFQMGNTVKQIEQYEATVYGNKRTETYSIKKDLVAVYDRDGAQLGDASWKGSTVNIEADDLYYSLFRAVHAQKTE